jgi:predicted glycosyltransferase
MKLVAYAVNGMGLGHLRRACALVISARKALPTLHALIITDANYSRLFDAIAVPAIILPRPANAPRNRSNQLKVRLSPELFDELAIRSIAAYGPDVTLFDTYVSRRVAKTVLSDGVRSCIVFRKCSRDTFVRYIRKRYFSDFDLVVVPHEEHEFKFGLPEALIAAFETQARVAYIGPVVFPELSTEIACPEFESARRKSKIVLMLSGGGGYDVIQSPFFQRAISAVDIVSARAGVPVQCASIVGPFSTVPHGSARVVPVAEPIDVRQYIRKSDLVISHGGYNSVNEVRACGARAIFAGFYRRTEDQRERLQLLADRQSTIILNADAEIGEIASAIDTLLKAQKPSPENLNGGDRFAECLLSLSSWARAPTRADFGQISNDMRSTDPAIEVVWDRVSDLDSDAALAVASVRLLLEAGDLETLTERAIGALDRMETLGIELNEVSVAFHDTTGGAQLPKLAKALRGRHIHSLTAEVPASSDSDPATVFGLLEECRSLRPEFDYEIETKEM